MRRLLVYLAGLLNCVTKVVRGCQRTTKYSRFVVLVGKRFNFVECIECEINKAKDYSFTLLSKYLAIGTSFRRICEIYWALSIQILLSIYQLRTEVRLCRSYLNHNLRLQGISH